MRRQIIACAVGLLAFSSAAQAQYVQRFNTVGNGAITFTGNTLGLDAEPNENGQGERGSIGTFIAENPLSRDINPSPSFGTPFFPFRTTNDWRENGSEATLRLPAGARVLHAELVWGGTYAGNSANDNERAFIDISIRFTTPSGTSFVAPDPATDETRGSVSGFGTCNNQCFYVRTANVTNLVAAGGAGRYAAGGIPATQGTTDNNNPSAGWTLVVVYEDFAQPIRSLSLFLGLEQSGGEAAEVAGFCTPPSGPLSGRLAVSAMEGDALITGDNMLFGRTRFLDNTDRVQGPRNPLNNFFAGQIAGDDGSLDTSGTFGDRNHTPGSPRTGGRQGWDITNVSVSARLRNNQTSAFALGTTSSDIYYITALALQIDVGAPGFRSSGAKFVDRATAIIGDVLTYTVLVDNSTGTVNATDVVFFDTPPGGTSFVAGSFTANGLPIPGANPVAGVPLGTIAAGTRMTVRFRARIDSIPTGPNPSLLSNQARWTFNYVSCAGLPPQAGDNVTNVVVTEVPVADLRITKRFLHPPAIAGAPVAYDIVVRNDGPSTAPNALVTDSGSAPALTGVSWTCAPHAGSATCSPASGTGPLSSNVSLLSGGEATFLVTGMLASNTPPGTITNSATITPPAAVPDFNLGNNTAIASAPIAASANLRVTKSGPADGQIGTNITYTIVVSNTGPSDAQNVVVTDPTPTGLTLVTGLSGPCAAAPGCTIPVGSSQTMTITFGIPPAYAGADPIVNTATASALTPDPNATNNSASASTSLDAPVVNLTITKTNGVTAVTAGQSTSYTITVTNAGPASALGSRVMDQFNPAIFANVQWQCAPSGTSMCTAVGLQTGDIDTLVDIDPGAANSVVFTAQALVRNDATGTAVNTATVTTATALSDSESANNSATDTDTITIASDVSVTKTGPTTTVSGTTVEYTVVVTNNGPSVATEILVEDVMFGPGRTVEFPEFLSAVVPPPGIVCQDRPTRGTISGREYTRPVCTIPSLAPLASLTFTWRFAIPSDLPGSPDSSTPALLNVANAIVSPSVDIDQSNNVAVVEVVVTPQADIAVDKTGPAAVVAGTSFSYFVTVSNNGLSTATNVVVEDPTPAGLTFVGGSGPCASFPCTIATLAPGEGQSTRIDLFVPIDYAGPPTLVNTASASSPVPDPVPGNNSAAVSTLVVPGQADLFIRKSGPSAVSPGQTFEYVIFVTNLGPGPAADVRVADVIPAGTTIVSGIPDPRASCTVPPAGTGNLISCLVPVLPVDAVLEFRFSVQASPDLVPGSVLTNVAAASSPTQDADSSNDRAEVVTRVGAPGEADVQIEKTGPTTSVVAGENVSYTIVVRNAGPAPATGVTLTDTLPAGFGLASATPSQGSCTDAICSLGVLAPSASATVTFVATTSATGVFVNTASVVAAEPDPIPANNTATQPTTVATADQADLVIEKLGPAILAPGSSSFYSIKVTNRGPANALNVGVIDSLPAGVTFVGNAGACATPFPCQFDSLLPGDSVTIQTAFTVDAALATPATVINTATVASLTSEADVTNNSSTVTTEIQATPSADLELTKRDSPDPVVAGTALSYSLTLSNRGPSDASGVTLTDALPAGVTLIAATSTQGTCTGTTTITCNVGSMLAGSTVMVGVLATAPPNVPSPNPMVNAASATASGPVDPNLANNTATETTTVLAPIADLAITKALTTTTAIPGLAVSYTIVVANDGPSAVTGASVTDAFPAALTAVSWTCTADAGSACSAASGAGNIAATVDLESGDSATFTVAATIVSSAVGLLSNIATIGTPAGATDPNPANNSALSTVPLVPSADLQVTKSGPVQAVAGGTLTYAITVTNAGPSDAVSVTLADPAPAGLTFVSGSGPCVSYPCALGTLPAGGTAVATSATFSIPSGYTTPDPIVNTATVTSATTPDPATGNNSATATTAIAAPITDLGITKTNGTTVVVPGSTTTYTIIVTNAGPSNAVGATVTDAVAPALTGVTWTCAGAGGGSCSVAAGSGNINTTIDVPVGATVTFSASGTIAPDAVGVLVNTATVTPGPGASDPSSANNTDADTLTPQVDLAITKAGPASVVPGAPLVYTITVTNSGPSNARNVVVNDPTPTGLEFVSNAGDCTTPFPCALGTLLVGAARTITATFTVPTGVSVPDPIVNTAVVTTTTPDTNASNNTATFEARLNRDADVEVTKSVLPANVRVGDSVVVTVNALNRGPNPASGVEVTDNLPAGLQFVSASTTQGAYDQATGLWTVGSVPVNATARLEITATVTSPGSITNLTVKTGQNEPDPNTANDSSAGTTNAVPAADVSIEKEVDRSDPLVGTTVTFTLRAANSGPSGATGVTIADTLPAGLTFVSAAPSQGSYDSGTGVWTVGALGAGSHATLTLVASADVAGALSNNAAVASQDQVDPNPLNNNDAASINAAPNADLRVTKAVSNAAPPVGAPVTYTVAVTNLGPSAATSAEILDALPAGVSFVSATASQGTYNPGTGVWTVGQIPVSGTETLSITVRVTALGALANTASRQASTPVDPNAVNDSATVAATPSLVADLEVTKTSNVATVAAGAPLTWTIVVSNRGPSDVAGAEVSDLFGAAFGNITWTCTPSAGAACGVGSRAGPITTTVDLASGAHVTFVATGIVAASALGELTNTASVAPPAPVSDPAPTNNSATASVVVTSMPQADVSVGKTGPLSVMAGRTATYVITVMNAGPSEAAGVIVDDPTPIGLTLSSVAGDCTALPCALGAIPPGAARSVTVVFAVPLAYNGPTPIVNTATVTSATPDPFVANNTSSATTTVTSGSFCDITGSGVPYFVTGAGPGGGPHVRLWTLVPGGVNELGSGFFAYDPSFPGGAAVACSDITGDGISRVIAAAGPGGGPHVRMFGYTNNQFVELGSGFFAYDPFFAGGVNVATGDLTGDGIAEVITGAGPGGGPHVRIWSYTTGAPIELAGSGFWAYDPAFPGGVNVASGDVTGDGVAELVTGAGPGGGPHVRVFTIANGAVNEIAGEGFFAYDPAFPGGVSVAVGDLDGDGIAEIVTGSGPGGEPQVRVFSLRPGAPSGSFGNFVERTGFLAYDPFFAGGVHVAAADVDGDGVAEILTGAGPGGGPHVRIWKVTGGSVIEVFGFFAYDPFFPGGVFISR